MSNEYRFNVTGEVAYKGEPIVPLNGIIQEKGTPWTETSTMFPGTFPPETMGVFIFVGK
jgi:hypothetical protein